MAKIESFEIVNPVEGTDIMVGTDVSEVNRPVKNFTIDSLSPLLNGEWYDFKYIMPREEIENLNNPAGGGNDVTTFLPAKPGGMWVIDLNTWYWKTIYKDTPWQLTGFSFGFFFPYFYGTVVSGGSYFYYANAQNVNYSKLVTNTQNALWRYNDSYDASQNNTLDMTNTSFGMRWAFFGEVTGGGGHWEFGFRYRFTEIQT
ncbi:MAG: hypothetical protein Unbinned1524contig1000_37 [Prokaryotic dsDNA virus sp.]|nr:MAG: hypothetical protein Unbinned1524contig1000_37 [Prokaryotic dsDNA virus sp.]|tara:strand:- start:1877 stop:2479 length:603 start_codon:yes stop_codon:yes gene_type:complete